MYEEKNIKILARFLLYLITLASVFLYGIINTYALETKTIYSSNSSGTLSNSNKYTYGFLNQGGVQTTSSASVNTTVNGRALALIYYMYEPVQLNHTYTMVVDFMSNDLINTFTSNMVQVATCNGEICNDNAIVSVTKNNPNGYSNKLTIQFNPVTSGSILLVNLSDKTATRYITGSYDNQYFGIKSVTLDNVNANQDIINNQTNNTNNIINNNNSNTQDIINNQNQNTQEIIESERVCSKKNYSLEIGTIDGTTGQDREGNNRKRTDYIEVKENNTYTIDADNTTSIFIFTYDKNKNFISRLPSNWVSIPYDYIATNNISYIRILTYNTTNDSISIKLCQNGNQAISDNLQDLNDSINDDDIGGATQDGADFILDFDTNTFGLTSIVTAPLNLIQSLTSSTCSELELPLPFLNNKKLKLPCMTTIYQNTFGVLFTMYQTITFGIIAYWVCVRIFNQVKDFKNPEHDEIEVVDL